MMRGCRRPVVKGSELRFGSYLMRTALPPLVVAYHNPQAAALSIGMLLNDSLSDCVNVTSLRMRQRWDPTFAPTEGMALSDYEVTGGYQLGVQSTDQGNDPFAFAAEWQKGLAGAGQIAGWVKIDLDDPEEIAYGISIFRSIMACAELPSGVEVTFPQPWLGSLFAGEKPADGHAFCLDGYDISDISNPTYDRCTWGTWTQDGVDLQFLNAYQFCGLAAVPTSWMTNPPPGIAADALMADLQALPNIDK